MLAITATAPRPTPTMIHRTKLDTSRWKSSLTFICYYWHYISPSLHLSSRSLAVPAISFAFPTILRMFSTISLMFVWWWILSFSTYTIASPSRARIFFTLLIVLSRGRQFRRNDASSASPRAIRVIGLIFLFLNANLWYLVLQPNSLVGNLTWIVCDSLDAFHHGPIAASSISQHALILWTQHAWMHDWSCHRHKTKDIRIILSADFFWTHFFKNSKFSFVGSY